MKKEIVETTSQATAEPSSRNGDVLKGTATVIDLSSSSSSSSSESDSDDDESLLESIGVDVGEDDGGLRKKRKLNELGVVFPVGFTDPITPLLSLEPETAIESQELSVNATVAVCNKQFWKAGDYEGAPCSDWDSSSGNLKILFFFHAHWFYLFFSDNIIKVNLIYMYMGVCV